MKSATDVMQEIIFSAVIDSFVAIKAASKGLPNTMVRELNAVHQNTTLADLPPELQAAIAANVRAAFTRLLKEGYSVSPGRAAPAAPPPRTREGPRPGPGARRPPPKRPGGDGPRSPRDGGRPPRDGGRPPGRGPKPRG
jgi:hypothetical protein